MGDGQLPRNPRRRGSALRRVKATPPFLGASSVRGKALHLLLEFCDVGDGVSDDGGADGFLLDRGSMPWTSTGAGGAAARQHTRQFAAESGLLARSQSPSLWRGIAGCWPNALLPLSGKRGRVEGAPFGQGSPLPRLRRWWP